MKEIDKEELLSQYFDGTLNEQESQFLSEWLKADPLHVEWFVQESYIHRCLHDLLRGQCTQKVLSNFDANEDTFEVDLWQALLEEERTAPSVMRDKDDNKSRLVTPKKVECPRGVGRTSKIMLALTLASIAAMSLMILYVYLQPSQISEPVATLIDAVNVEWAEASGLIKPGSRLFTRQGSMQLKQGIVKIRFDNGSEVLLEAPSEFELLTYDQLELRYGRVYTKVPKGVAGFTVSTPHSKVIDLGTEFGVQANVDGTSEVHVMKGKISLVSGVRSNSSQSQIVRQGKAKFVEKNSAIPRDIPFDEHAFVQDIDSQTHCVWRGEPLDLVDIVGGGNGLGTGKTGVCIDLETGTYMKEVAPSGHTRSTPYIVTSKLPYIDGVFIPDGGEGSIQVSSLGHQFVNCPDTTGKTFYGVFNGSTLPIRVQNQYRPHSIAYRGQMYGTPEHPAIMLHTNMGVTFDLDQIRQVLPPGTRIANFAALCCLARGPEDAIRSDDFSDFHVLVDGVERFQASDMLYRSEARKVDLELTDGDRFLTLVTTDGKDMAVHLGWAFFAEPQLGIEKVDPR